PQTRVERRPAAVRKNCGLTENTADGWHLPQADDPAKHFYLRLPLPGAPQPARVCLGSFTSPDSQDRRTTSAHAPADARDETVTVTGWSRTRRHSRAVISIVHLSYGSSCHPVQVLTPNTLPNYANEILKVTPVCAVEATGKIVLSPAKGQPFEMQASAINVIG